MSRLVRNVTALLAAEAANTVLTVVLLVIAARYYGEVSLGKLAFAQVVASYLNLIANFGTTNYVSREIAHDNSRAKYFAKAVVMLRVPLACVLILMMAGTSALLPQFTHGESVLFYAVLIAMVLLPSLDLSAVFYGLQRQDLGALFSTITKVVTFVVTLGLMPVVHSILVVPLGQAFGLSLSLVLQWWYFLRLVPKGPVEIAVSSLGRFWAAAAPLGVTFLVSQIYLNMDSLLLSFMASDQVVGWYSASYRIVGGLTAVSRVVMAVFSPAISSLHIDPAGARLALIRSLRVMTALALPVAVGGYMTGTELMRFVFGHAYEPGGYAFSVLALSVGVLYIGNILGYTLMAVRQEKKYLIGVTLASIVNVVLNLILIPKYSLNGAAWATLASQIVVTVWCWKETKSSYHLKARDYVLHPLVATLAMALSLAIAIHAHVHVTLCIVFGSVTYVGVLYAFRAEVCQDVSFILQSVNPRRRRTA